MNAFEFDGWLCDPRSLTIKTGKQVVRLELKVMTVLYVLAVKSPDVVSRDELMAAAWPGVVVSDGAIYRVITLLRKALNDREKPHKYIESISRVGYRLKVKTTIYGKNLGVLSTKEQQKKTSLTISAKGKNTHPALDESITMIERHVSWRCPILSIQRASKHSQSDFNVEVNLSPNKKVIELKWQILSKEDNELVYAGLHSEPRLTQEPLPTRVAEMVAESITRESLRHRIKQIGENYNPKSLRYWDLINLGDRFVSMQSKQINWQRELLNQAITMAPKVAAGHAAMGKLLSWEVLNGVAKNSKANVSRAKKCTSSALAIDPSDPFVTSSCGLINSRIGNYDLGIQLCRQTLLIAPSAQAKDALATSLCFAGKPDEAIELYLQIFASMPAGQIFHFGKLVLPLVQSGQIERALEYANLSTLYLPGDFFSWALRSNISAQLGNLDGARADLRQAKKLLPSLNLQHLISSTERNYGRTTSQRQGLTSGYKRLLEKVGA